MRGVTRWVWAIAVGGALAASPVARGVEGATAAAPLPDLELEALLALPVDTVSTASKREQEVSSAPASVTVITAQEIEAFGHRTLAEVLDGVRGLYTSYDRNYTYLGVRGFSRSDYNSRVLLLVDGHQLNDDVYDMAFVGSELPLDLALVERVEIVRGPGSVLYGGNAVFGVVNVITKRATRLAGAELEVGAGSAEAFRGRATYGFVREAAEGVLSVSASTAAGRDLFFPEYAGQGARGDGVARGDDWDRVAHAFAKVAAGGLTLQAAGGARHKGVPTGSWGTVYDDGRNETLDVRGFAELRWERPAGGAGPAWALRAYYDHYDFRERYAYGTEDPSAPTYVNRDDAAGRWAGAEARARLSLGERVEATAGAEVELHFRQDQRNRDEGPDGVVWMDERHRSAVAAAYGHVEARPARWLELVGGLRYDVYEAFGGVLSPRAAALLRPRDATVVKALYGRAFRPPNASELHYQHPQFWTQAGALDPEVIDTAELALEQQLGETVRATVVVYRYWIRDLVTDAYGADGMGTSVNADAARAQGVEGELEWRSRRGAAARLSWAAQRATDDATGDRLAGSPAQVGKLQLRAPLGGRLRGAVELLYLSDRTAVGGAEVRGHVRANVTLTARGLARGALDLSAGLHNALDASYSDPARGEHLQAAIPQDGRTFRLDVTCRF